MKSRTPSFVIELGLKTGEDQESALETYFSDARQLFNAVLGTAKKHVRAMKSTDVVQEKANFSVFSSRFDLEPGYLFLQNSPNSMFSDEKILSQNLRRSPRRHK